MAEIRFSGNYLEKIFDLIKQPETENEKDKISSHNYGVLRIAFELLCKQYDISSDVTLDDLGIGEKELIGTLTDDYKKRVNEQLTEYKEFFPGNLEENFNTIYESIENGNVRFLEDRVLQEETIEKIQEKAERQREMLKEIVNRIPTNLINAIVLQYFFGVIVLSEHFMENIEGNKENPNYPFQVGYKNKPLFGWIGQTRMPEYSGQRISSVPRILELINKNRQTVARSAVLCVIQAHFSSFTINTWDENMILKRDLVQQTANMMEILPDEFEGEIRKTDWPEDEGWGQQVFNMSRGLEIPSNWQHFDRKANKKIKNSVKPTKIDIMLRVKERALNFLIKMATKNRIDLGHVPETTDLIPTRTTTPEPTEIKPVIIDVAEDEISEILPDI